MKVCILSSFDNLMQKDTGSSVRIHYLAYCLASTSHDVQVIIPKEKATQQHFDGVVVQGLTGLSPSSVLKFISKLLGISKPNTLLFYDLLFVERACRIIRRCDIAQIEQQSAGGIFAIVIKRILKKPLVFDCHDIFQALRVKHTSTQRRVLETLLEKIAYRYADLILVVSEKEKECLVSYGVDKRKIAVIPNGVDTQRFAGLSNQHFQDQSTPKKNSTVIFVGNMEYLPNQEAVRAISSEIAPRVQKEIGSVRFLIVGRKGDIEGARSLSNLEFAGVVDDVAKCLGSSDVAIAPLFHGSGTRLKILEYFSSSLPVVSTSVGVEGLDVENGVNVYIEDDMNLFAQRVTQLLKDRTAAANLGRAARELVVNKYDWRTIVERLDNLYSGLLS